MRWLLVKDLQILRRSPLVAALLVIYPAAIAVLIGFAISRGPEKPRVAFLSEVPENQRFQVGNEEFDVLDARNELFERLDIIRVQDRDEARRKVREGEALGALILPEDLVEKLRSAGLEQPTVDVLVNQDDPVKERLVDDRISALLSEANLRLSRQFSKVTLDYLGLLLRGGKFDFLGTTLDVLGLTNSQRILEAVKGGLPPGGERRAVDQVIGFSRLARQNLNLADELLASVSEPIKVNKEVVSGETPALGNFAIAVAATLTLAFVTMLLVAGFLALEREENAFSRLVRGLVSATSLLTEKIVLGVLCALAVTLLMLAGLTPFVHIDWGRLPLIAAAIVAGGAGFAALGAAIGGLAREVRAASLLAFMLSLPIAFLSLVPSGTVSPALFDVIRTVAAAFPFRASLDALSGALDASGPSLPGPLLHLLLLTAAYGALARLSLNRFA